jgi:hypothetical protein
MAVVAHTHIDVSGVRRGARPQFERAGIAVGAGRPQDELLRAQMAGIAR